MIVRVLRARVRAGKVGAFNALFRGQVTLVREQPGLVYVKLARRLQPDGSEEAILFEEWEDAASLYAWVGPNLNEPRLVPGSRELIDELLVSHYEALDKEAEAPRAAEAPRGAAEAAATEDAAPRSASG
jgi:antibiotic biosynthesis monooxygenase